MPTLLMWCEADKHVDLATLAVTDWGDPAYTRLTQGVNSNRFAFVADRGDGLPELTGSIDDFMKSASTLALSTFAVWFGFRNTNAAAILLEHSPNGTSNGHLLFAGEQTIIVNRGIDTTSYNATVADRAQFQDGTDILVRHSFDGTNAGHGMFVDGTEISYESNGDTDDPSGTIDDTFNLGSRNGDSNFISGAANHLIIASPIPPAEEIASMDIYVRRWL